MRKGQFWPKKTRETITKTCILCDGYLPNSWRRGWFNVGHLPSTGPLWSDAIAVSFQVVELLAGLLAIVCSAFNPYRIRNKQIILKTDCLALLFLRGQWFSWLTREPTPFLKNNKLLVYSPERQTDWQYRCTADFGQARKRFQGPSLHFDTHLALNVTLKVRRRHGNRIPCY